MTLRHASLICFSILTGGLNAACYHLQPAVIPMAVLPYPANDSADERAEDLVVLLPGLGDYATAFEEQGLVAHLRGPEFAAQPVDVLAVNAHFKYYRNKTAIERLHADVIVPAKEAGYRRIHLVGISLGGFGALRYLRDYPNEVESVALLAPFVGEQEYYGVLASPEAVPGGEATEAENPWPWIRALPKDVLARVYLGYGDRDRVCRGPRCSCHLARSRARRGRAGQAPLDGVEDDLAGAAPNGEGGSLHLREAQRSRRALTRNSIFRSPSDSRARGSGRPVSDSCSTIVLGLSRLNPSERSPDWKGSEGSLSPEIHPQGASEQGPLAHPP